MEAKPVWFDQADAALLRAAQRAREIAVRTNTPLLLIHEGKLVRQPPEKEMPELPRPPQAPFEFAKLIS